MFNPAYSPTQVAELQRSFLNRVFLWMTAGLLVTAAVATGVASSPAIINLVHGNPMIFFGLFIVQIAMVFGLSLGIGKLSPAVATAIFMLYAVINGVTLSGIVLAYTGESIATTFFVTAGTFGAMAAYGYTTKRDLSGLGSIAVMALIGLLIASVVNIFLANSTLYWILTYAGVLIFVALTAWDVQKLKRIGTQIQDETSAGRMAILGALTLYLDFINLFLYMLRILGRRN